MRRAANWGGQSGCAHDSKTKSGGEAAELDSEINAGRELTGDYDICHFDH